MQQGLCLKNKKPCASLSDELICEGESQASANISASIMSVGLLLAWWSSFLRKQHPSALPCRVVPLKKKKNRRQEKKWCLGASLLKECGWRLYIEGALSSFASFERDGMQTWAPANPNLRHLLLITLGRYCFNSTQGIKGAGGHVCVCVCMFE